MTEPYKIIEVKESVFADNDREAARLRTQLKQDRTFLLNLMSSPGSGKTTTLLRTLEALKDELRIGVMEADIDSDVDAKTIADAGVKSIQLHTGGMCHLDASMTEQGLKEIGTKDLDLVVLENVGNLVCHLWCPRFVSICNSKQKNWVPDVTDRDKRPARVEPKQKRPHANPWRDSHAADRGYAAKVRP